MVSCRRNSWAAALLLAACRAPTTASQAPADAPTEGPATAAPRGTPAETKLEGPQAPPKSVPKRASELCSVVPALCSAQPHPIWVGSTGGCALGATADDGPPYGAFAFVTVILTGTNQDNLPSITTHRSPFRISLDSGAVRPSKVDQQHTVMASGSMRSVTFDTDWREPEELPILVVSADGSSLELPTPGSRPHFHLFAERLTCERWWSRTHNGDEASCRLVIEGHELSGRCTP